MVATQLRDLRRPLSVHKVSATSSNLTHSGPQYPYVPPHISRPTELKTVFLVETPPHSPPSASASHLLRSFSDLRIYFSFAQNSSPSRPTSSFSPCPSSSCTSLRRPRTSCSSNHVLMLLYRTCLRSRYENSARYGPQLAAIPHLLARSVRPCFLAFFAISQEPASNFSSYSFHFAGDS